MNKRILSAAVAIIIIAAVVVAVVLSRASGGDVVTGDTFATSAGRTFTITLESNATTGFTWSQDIADDKIVAFEGVVYNEPDTSAMGAPGSQTFTFKAVAEGTTTITLTYARLWESVPPANTRTITVTVK
jgi:inhibitor of cysteine peptidase